MVRDAFPRAFQYSDCWADDARLVVLNAVDAAERGACVLPRTEVVSALREGGLWHATLSDATIGARRPLRARAIANAAGPWVERVLGKVAGVNTEKRVRLVKGSHIILKRWWVGDHAYVLQNADRQLIFVNPYFDDLALMGATDIPFEGRVEESSRGCCSPGASASAPGAARSSSSAITASSPAGAPLRRPRRSCARPRRGSRSGRSCRRTRRPTRAWRLPSPAPATGRPGAPMRSRGAAPARGGGQLLPRPCGVPRPWDGRGGAGGGGGRRGAGAPARPWGRAARGSGPRRRRAGALPARSAPGSRGARGASAPGSPPCCAHRAGPRARGAPVAMNAHDHVLLGRGATTFARARSPPSSSPPSRRLGGRRGRG